MKKFIRFEPLSGRVLAVGMVPDTMLALQGDHVLEGEADYRSEYIVDGQVLARPSFAVSLSATQVRADGNDQLLLAGVPTGATLRINGPVSTSGTVTTAGEVTLTFALAGSYEIQLELFPCMDWKAIIDAL